MRITFILPPPNLSGGLRVAAIYAEKLGQLGHDVLVVSPPPPVPSLREKIRAVVKRRELWHSRRRMPPSHLDGRAIRHHVLDRYRPVTDGDVPDADVVIATWWETAPWVYDLTPSKGAKAYFLQHYEVFHPLPADKVRATWTLPMHKIVIAQWLKDLARDRFDDPHASLVPNAVDLDQFYAPPRGKQGAPTVGMLYSLADWKGCPLSLAALDLAWKQLPELRLQSFGETPPNPQIPLPRNAYYSQRPAQDRLKNIYASCDAWLFGSRSEGFGLPLLEAMACRTPIIATPAGAAPELVEKGGGVLVPYDDPEAMAKEIVRICTLPDDDWRAMSDRAYNAATSYTWDDAARRFEAALMTAVNRASRGEIRPTADMKAIAAAAAPT